MRFKSNYNLHTTKQLIDINQGINNFKATIHIKSKNKEDIFDILVLTSDELNEDDFEQNYKQIQNEIKINVESDEDEDTSYILIMRSNNQINVDVTIELDDLDDNSDNSEENKKDDLNIPIDNDMESFMNKDKNSESFCFKKFIQKNKTTLLIIIALALVFYFFILKKDKNEGESKGESKGDSSSDNNNVIIDNSIIDNQDFSLNKLNIDSLESEIQKDTKQSTSSEQVDRSTSNKILENLRNLRKKN